MKNLSQQHQKAAEAAFEHDDLLVPSTNSGLLEAENDLERTWRIGQNEIKDAIGINAATKGFDLSLETFGPYAVDYTSNGRYVAKYAYCKPRKLTRV